MDDLSGQLDEMNQEDIVLIRLVVEAIHFPQHLSTLNSHLTQAEEAGWGSLVGAIREILRGKRSLASFEKLDDEDRRIVIAILRGLDDATELPDVVNTIDPNKAGLKIATLLMAMRSGSAQAGQSLSSMITGMAGAGGDMAQVGLAIVDINNGERDMDRLCRNIGLMGSKIIRHVLEELEKRELT
jgi:hypothetical protein